MDFVHIRTGRPFKGTVPDVFYLPVAKGLGTGVVKATKDDEESVVRWMFLHGYVPKKGGAVGSSSSGGKQDGR